MTFHSHIRPRAVLLSIAATAAVAAPAGAATTPLTGTQTPIDVDAGTAAMHGSLVGTWSTLTFRELSRQPLYRARGTERFDGCLDRGGDGSCAGDPSGTLRFRFRYWALPSPDPAGLTWGACLHVITRGTRDFGGAEGVIVMADAPTADAVITNYAGTLALPATGTRARRAAHAGTAHAGTAHAGTAHAGTAHAGAAAAT